MLYILSVILFLFILYYIVDRYLYSLKLDNLKDRHVFVTGCDSGFGRALAVQLDKLGFHVFAGCLTSEGARSLSETCSSKVTTVDLDVTKTESVAAALDFVQKKLPEDTGLWALVNNAGILGLFKTDLCIREDYFKVINVNLLGVVDMTIHFLPLIRKCQGRIVNISSVAGRIGCFPAPYTVSKYGVEGFSDTIRRELFHEGISVSILEPGGFKTSIFDVDRDAEAMKKAYERANPGTKRAHAFVQGFKGAMHSVKGFFSSDLQPVINAYVHAITARYPRTRYVVGVDAKYLFIPMSYLPACVTDRIISRFFSGMQNIGKKAS